MGTYVIREAYERVQDIEQSRAEMKRHRQVIKQALHPGVTQKEAGFTDADRARLAAGVCADLAAARGVWNGLRYAAVLWIVLLGVLAVGYALRTGPAVPPVPHALVVR